MQVRGERVSEQGKIPEVKSAPAEEDVAEADKEKRGDDPGEAVGGTEIFPRDAQ